MGGSQLTAIPFSQKRESIMKVGFVGLGVMGGPMALNILKGGHVLTVFDLDPKAVKRLVEAGAKAAASPRDVGAASEVVVTMLPEPKHVEDVVLGKNGVAEGLARGGVVIDMSTIDPMTSRRVGDELKKRGLNMVDSPVGKTSEHAVTGTLTLMVGGEKDVIERVKPVLSCMGTDTYICGGQGAGHAMKITNNLLATTIMAANTEALAIGVKSGLDLDMMMEIMKTTMSNNAQLYVAMPKKAFKGDDSPGFMVKLAAKDVRLAVELGRSMGFEPLVGAACQKTLENAMAKGFADRDTAALMRIREDELGVKVRQKA
jgi:4-hydroxybutyrate dehydrogenase/sulfolactaldehyde 3-reductase